MEINKTLENDTLNVALTGRLDTVTAPVLDSEVVENVEGFDKLVLDFKALEYISSAGLRVLLSAQKKMKAKGGMIIKNVSAEVMEIFDITGFSDILTIEK